ncbi:unnamed protein product [Larinioides sclopetarius]|uniref:Uncharacterized protein n=1 Tax=Larinioides sclopetarius TaxID=280406 RepID=A0AAV1Z6I5_9ARAC
MRPVAILLPSIIIRLRTHL